MKPSCFTFMAFLRNNTCLWHLSVQVLSWLEFQLDGEHHFLSSLPSCIAASSIWDWCVASFYLVDLILFLLILWTWFFGNVSRFFGGFFLVIFPTFFGGFFWLVFWRSSEVYFTFPKNYENLTKWNNSVNCQLYEIKARIRVASAYSQRPGRRRASKIGAGKMRIW